jgi:plasmid stabilization system protein ParE
MTFQVELTPIAEFQIEQAYQWYRDRNPEFADRWFRSVMNRISTLQVQPHRWALAVEHEIFPEEVRQLLHGQARNVYRILFTIRETRVIVLYVRHSAQAPLTEEDLEDDRPSS